MDGTNVHAKSEHNIHSTTVYSDEVRVPFLQTIQERKVEELEYLKEFGLFGNRASVWPP